jgi:hypothetical protein
MEIEMLWCSGLEKSAGDGVETTNLTGEKLGLAAVFHSRERREEKGEGETEGGRRERIGSTT